MELVSHLTRIYYLLCPLKTSLGACTGQDYNRGNNKNYTQIVEYSAWHIINHPRETLLLLLLLQVASVVSDSVQPQRQQPTRLGRPWDSPGKNTGVGCHFLLRK